MPILGCDISGWQPGDPRYDGMSFVYSKITQGLNILNPNHDAQVAKARAEGLIVGHYHFPAWGDPRAEARAFWAACGAQTGEFLVLDIEDSQWTPWPADPVSWCCAFEDELMSLSGTWAMDYAGPNVRFRPGWDWTPLAQRGGGLIDPEYNPVGPGSPAPWATVAMWQNADTNISGGDSDVFYGDRAALIAYGIGGTINPQGYTPTEQDVFSIMTASPEEQDAFIDRFLNRQVTQPDGNKNTLGEMLAEYRGHYTATIDEIDKIPDAILNKPVPNATGGQTSLGAMVGWNDEHVNALMDALRLKDPAAVAAAIPADIAKAVADELAKRLTQTK